jgi:HemY protein
MLRVFLLFMLLIAGIILGPLFAGRQGYVLIQTRDWNIETSVTGLVIILLVALFVILVLEWLLRRILITGQRTRGWFSGRKTRRARRHTKVALTKLAEGDYQQVEKLLAKDAEHADNPVANYLLAAEAAQQRGDATRADQHIERAAELSVDNQIPVEITKARLLLARQEYHAARHSIDRILDVAPRHPQVLKIAEQAYFHTGAWRSLLDILPAMQKEQIAPEEHIEALGKQAWLGLMDQAMAEQGSEGLKHWWQHQSRKTRQDVTLQVAMAEHLIACNDHEAAQSIVIDGLKNKYDERLILLLPKLHTAATEESEKIVMRLIKQQGSQPLLNSTLGQLCMRQGLWQRAAEAFTLALNQRPDALDYAWIADAYEKMRRPEEAAKMRRAGLMLTLKQDANS